MESYKPLEDYGLVGNLETCAFVGRDGSIDWLPVPHTDAESVFAAVLDEGEGGQFRVEPAGEYEAEQSYLERTNVLQTTFDAPDGTVVVTDFMSVSDGEPSARAFYRRVECTDGEIVLDVTFAPRPGYARTRPDLEWTSAGVRTAGGDPPLRLRSPESLTVSSDGDQATGQLDVEAGDVRWFALSFADSGDGVGDDPPDDPEPATPETCERRLEETVGYWRDWSHDCGNQEEGTGECVFHGPWHDVVVRAGLVLKLLHHVPSGAITAAPTTSLPEAIGGERNWDYRFSWLRDTAFTVQALSNLGHTGCASDYYQWFSRQCTVEDPADIQPLYTLDGEPAVEERTLDHLEGYRGSAPVRVGNAAANQHQLDIYGELLLALTETVPEGNAQSAHEVEWETIEGLVEYVAESWDQPGAGIWEVRSDPQHFVFSKVMCWVALDRGIAAAERRDREDAPVERWRDVRQKIREAVLEKGYDQQRGTFTRSFGSDTLDASTLLLPIVGFLPFDDERVQGTVDAVKAHLLEDGLVYRYTGEDGISGEEGAFCICSCWLASVLALSGRLDEARELFEELLSYVGPLGLLAEEADPDTGCQLGNHPLALSHAGIINTALYIGLVEGREAPGPEPLGTSLGEQTAIPDATAPTDAE